MRQVQLKKEHLARDTEDNNETNIYRPDTSTNFGYMMHIDVNNHIQAGAQSRNHICTQKCPKTAQISPN